MAYQYVREPLTSEEADSLQSACQSTEEKLVVWTLLDTALRVSELCSLTPDKILYQQKALRVKGKGGVFGKGPRSGAKGKKHTRGVPLRPRSMKVLEVFFALEREWFCKPRQAQNIVKRVADRAQISKPATPHVLRHTAACNMLQRGLSLAAVQKILGQARLETTAIYLNLTEDHVLEEFHAKM